MKSDVVVMVVLVCLKVESRWGRQVVGIGIDGKRRERGDASQSDGVE